MAEPAIQKTPFDTYKDLMDECFNKIKKTLPAKKYKELIELSNTAHEQVTQLKDDKEQLNANKYFYIFKLALESKIPRLMEFLLYRIQKLFTYEFLDGNCEDNCKYADENKPPEKNGRLPRLLIDAIVEAICECAHERDNQVQLQVIKALLTIVIAVNSKVHERTLLEAFKTQYSIHITSTSQVNKNTAKASLTQMINVVFSKMDTYMRYGNQETIDIKKLSQSINQPQMPLSARSQGHINQQNFLSSQIHQQHALDQGLSTKGAANPAQAALSTDITEKPQNSNQSREERKFGSGSNMNTSEEGVADNPASSFHHRKSVTSVGSSGMSAGGQSVDVTFTPIDQYVFSLVQNMVDNVSLHDARVQEVKARRKEHEAVQEEHELQEEQLSDNNEEKQQNQGSKLSLEEEIARIPLNPIPYSKKECPEVDLQNELGIDSGRFGWCIVCRNTANLYCKDTKHPVCSQECKKKHLVETNALDGPPIDSLPNFNKLDEAGLAYTDAILVFRSIVKLSIGGDSNSANQSINPFAMRTKIIGLELILAVLEKPKQPFLTKKAFIDVIKNTLCDGLLRYSVSNEKTVFSLVASIFFCLFLHFRKHLKSVILVFIETIFLKLLDSGNSSFHHKELILNVFDKISQNSMMMLEIFVNYDCDIAQKDISKHIVESLSKIANGKFKMSEHQNIISVQEETILRRHATQILVQMLRSFNATIDAEIAESKVTSKMIQTGALSVNKAPQQNELEMSTGHNHSESLEQDLSTSQHNPNTSGYGESEDQTMISYDSVGNPTNKRANQFQDLQKQRNVKEQRNLAAQKFNSKWKLGIKQLVQLELVPDPEVDYQGHVKGIIDFLKTTPTLSKTVIGEFLGVDKALNRDCLSEFINQYDLKDVPFVVSLKTILQGFRLPGEGQIVDRVMERFGEKFVADNPNGSDDCQGQMSAECVYLLSYATMMMQTSLHNPNAVKSRMTVEDFAKMLKGINSGENLREEFIKKIYDHVERDPFTLNEDDDARIKAEAQNANSLKRKQDLFQKEGINLINRGKTQIAQQGNNNFISLEDCKAIRPLFENTWTPNLVTFSRILEETSDEEIAGLCIEGFAHSIKICGYYNMSTERAAFVSSLAKFTQVSNERRIKSKNIQVIQKILELATNQGNYLGESWQFVLECISKLEEMINLGSGQMKDRDFFDPNANKDQVKQSKSSQAAAASKKLREETMMANSELVVQNIYMSQIDAIFQGSLNLDQDAIISFIENLCKVSRTELADTSNPRKFSLQCLVEVADLNMARIRFVWSKIWQMLSAHFIEVGSHGNLMVAIFAIDSLRQLADKFLLKEEFKKFNFQKDFLRPFEQIMLNNLHTRSDIKEYIVMCITNISGTKTVYIKSGWSVIINIFTLAAQDNEEMLVSQSFNALKVAVTQYFDLLEDGFVELVNCLNKYSMNSNFPKQSQEAQQLLLICAEKLQDPQIVTLFEQKQGMYFYQTDLKSLSNYPPQYGLAANAEKESSPQDVAEEVDENKRPCEAQIKLSVMKGLWFPIMTNLTNLSMDKNTENQAYSLDILFDVLLRGVQVFDLSFWREILSQVFLPMLEDIDLAIETPSRKNDKKERTFYLNTMQCIVDKLNRFFLNNIEMSRPVISSYIDIVFLFMSTTQSSKIIEVLVQCYHQFLLDVGGSLSSEDWDKLTTSYKLCFEKSLPEDFYEESDKVLKTGDDSVATEEQLDKLFSKGFVQAFLVDSVEEILFSFFKEVSVKNTLQLVDCLEKSYETARNFNSRFDTRVRLWTIGFQADEWALPGLTNVEYRSIASIITIKFMMYFNPRADQPEDNEKTLFELCQKVLLSYTQQHAELLQLEDHQSLVELAYNPADHKRTLNSSISSERQQPVSRSVSSRTEVADDAKSENASERYLSEAANRPSQEVVTSEHNMSNEEKRKQARRDREAVPIQRWHRLELIRQLDNQTPIILSNILANFEKLSEEQLMTHQKQIGSQLIELSECDNHQVRRENKKILTNIFDLLNSKLPE